MVGGRLWDRTYSKNTLNEGICSVEEKHERINASTEKKVRWAFYHVNKL
jgi:hypothetical protein